MYEIFATVPVRFELTIYRLTVDRFTNLATEPFVFFVWVYVFNISEACGSTQFVYQRIH